MKINKKQIVYSLAIFAGCIFQSAALLADGWRIDPSSSIVFRASSRFGEVRGSFFRWEFAGQIQEDLRPTGEFRIVTGSLTTGNNMRDNHLKSPDFLDVQNFNFAVFHIDRAEITGASAVIHGEITIRGIKKPLVFTLVKSEKDGRLRLAGEFKINRRDFHIDYDSAMNPIEDEVAVELDLLLMR